jgi:ferredoxin-NADP reductase
MKTVASIVLAGLFVFLAGFNAWNMLSNRGASARSRSLWIQVHRAAGYVFIALFWVFCYFMLLRLKGWSDELSPRLVLHMALALLLAPLLLVKVIVARYQKSARGLLTALGIAIFAIAFTLVAMNASVHYSRTASSSKAPTSVSLVFLATVVITASAGFVKKHRPVQPKADKQSAAATHDGAQLTNSATEAVELTLASIEVQTPDAKTLRFLLPSGRRLGARPGQFMSFDWTIDGQQVRRSYSICSSPVQARYIEITPKRVPDGYVSRFLNDVAKPRLVVRARGPLGKFFFDESKHRRVVFIAGGSGITPMMAMLRYVDDLCIPAHVTLIYCSRSQEDIIFRRELEAFGGRIPNFHYVPVLSEPSGEWIGWKGRLRHEIVEAEIDRPADSTFFLCGPPAFMDHVHGLLKDIGVQRSQILQESFGTSARSSPPAATRVTVGFALSAVEHVVSTTETLLESAERFGVSLPFGCRQGQCGTCMTELLSGNVEMSGAEALNDEQRAQGFILPCVSRPTSDVTLKA